MQENKTPTAIQKAITRGVPLSLTEAAKIVNISRSELYERTQTGEIKTIKSSVQKILIWPEELARFLNLENS